jgi:uncharacterized membrane protein
LKRLLKMTLLRRMARHLMCDRPAVRRCFPPATLDAIERAIAAGEQSHRGELRFVIEPSLAVGDLWRGRSARDRAIELFAQLGIWDTEHNAGILIYLLLADRRVEIVADRGVHRRAGDAAWARICAQMQAEFRRGQFEVGALAGIAAAGALLGQHFPSGEGDAGNPANELPDRPLIL